MGKRKSCDPCEDLHIGCVPRGARPTVKRKKAPTKNTVTDGSGPGKRSKKKQSAAASDDVEHLATPASPTRAATKAKTAASKAKSSTSKPKKKTSSGKATGSKAKRSKTPVPVTPMGSSVNAPTTPTQTPTTPIKEKASTLKAQAPSPTRTAHGASATASSKRQVFDCVLVSSTSRGRSSLMNASHPASLETVTLASLSTRLTDIQASLQASTESHSLATQIGNM